MARPIKFRAWDGKQMWRVTSISWSEDKLHELGLADDKRHFAFGENIGLERFILMQFTGLTDCKYREIWEGDILQTKGVDGTLLWEVKYFSDDTGSTLGAFEAEPIGHQFSSVHNEVVDKSEVLGNIYENKELLNAEG